MVSLSGSYLYVSRKVMLIIDDYFEHLSKYNLSEFAVQHFCEVAIDYQNGIFEGEDGVIGQVTGQAPQTVEAFVSANRHAFEA